MAKVTTNWSGVEEVLLSSETANMIHDRAQAVLSAAQASAPVVTGAYRDSLRIVDDETSGSHGAMRRSRSRVVAGVEYGFLVEADHGTLKRAKDAAQ